ncbi:hypothetical protein BC941DRAFT_412346 [Chlamydoabsidia padenii]|nr:hypothetical protein BC941DRAFT_412346 [Chlamydoabsidia padenii]
MELDDSGYSNCAIGQQGLISNNNSAYVMEQPLEQPGLFPSSKPQAPPLMIDTNQTTSNFTLHQFTSDQARDQIVELEDIFKVFDGGFLQQEAGTAHLIMDESNWELTATPTALSSTTNYNNGLSTETIQSFGNNNNTATSNYCTPLSSPMETHFYTHTSMQSPTQQQYNYNYHNNTYQYQQQYLNHNNPRPQYHQRPYTSSTNNNNYGMVMSMPSSPSLLSQQLPSDFDSIPNRENEAMYVPNSSSVQPTLPIGSLNSKLLGKHGSQQHTSCINNTLSTPPLSTSSSLTSATISTTHNNKNDEISNTDDDCSMENINGNTNYNLASSSTTMNNNDQNYPLTQYQHQHVFPASAPTTPPFHTQHQSNPFDHVPPPHTTTISATTASSARTDAKPICTNCGATSTPLWRRSSEDELLCNACGLYQKLHKAPRPKTLKPNNARKEIREEEAIQLICSNCSTTTTPLWRRDDEGAPLCNACGLYLKLHHERRPLSMKTDIIKKRQRYETNTQSNCGRKTGKKTKGESSSSSSLSSPSHSSPPSPEGLANLMDKDYHMVQPSPGTAPSSPTSSILLPYRYIHLPNHMNHTSDI